MPVRRLLHCFADTRFTPIKTLFVSISQVRQGFINILNLHWRDQQASMHHTDMRYLAAARHRRLFAPSHSALLHMQRLHDPPLLQLHPACCVHQSAPDVSNCVQSIMESFIYSSLPLFWDTRRSDAPHSCRGDLSETKVMVHGGLPKLGMSPYPPQIEPRPAVAVIPVMALEMRSHTPIKSVEISHLLILHP